MKIKMIGTGAVYAKENNSSCLVDDKILIDCGNGIFKALLKQNISINDLDTLLITHIHGDHFLDLPFLILQRSVFPSETKLNIYGPVGLEKTYEQIMNLIYSDIKDLKLIKNKANISFIEFDSLDNQEICPGYFATSYNVLHGNFSPSYGFTIKHKNKTLGLSGDSAYCENIEKIVQISDISILDTTFINGTSGHMGAHDIEKLANTYNKRIIPTHLSPSSKEYLIKNKINNIIVLNDGEIIKI